MKGAWSLGVDENTEILVPRCGHQLESEEGTTHDIFEILKSWNPHSMTPDPSIWYPSDSGFCTQRGLARRSGVGVGVPSFQDFRIFIHAKELRSY